MGIIETLVHTQFPALLFPFRNVASSDAAGVVVLPGVSPLSCGVPTLGITPGGASCLVPGPRSVSPDLERINDPGSPTNGLSSINSSPYRERRLNDSASVLVSWKTDPVLVICDPSSGPLAAASESGIGVFSLLC